MLPLKKALLSSVGKKYVMGVTGLALIGFMFTHLYGNLALYWPSGDPFNRYTKSLHDWGGWLTAAELGLGALFVVHAAMAVYLQWEKQRARKEEYAAGLRTKGGPSHMNFFSRNMFWASGFLLLGFLVIHVLQFRFGPNMLDGYTVTLDGEEARDLHRLVREVFQDPVWVAIYVIAVGALAAHVRHGFWSALQSLGAMHKSLTKPVYVMGSLIALLFFAGFALIPIFLYLEIPWK